MESAGEVGRARLHPWCCFSATSSKLCRRGKKERAYTTFANLALLCFQRSTNHTLLFWRWQRWDELAGVGAGNSRTS